MNGRHFNGLARPSPSPSVRSHSWGRVRGSLSSSLILTNVNTSVAPNVSFIRTTRRSLLEARSACFGIRRISRTRAHIHTEKSSPRLPIVFELPPLPRSQKAALPQTLSAQCLFLRSARGKTTRSLSWQNLGFSCGCLHNMPLWERFGSVDDSSPKTVF